MSEIPVFTLNGQDYHGDIAQFALSVIKQNRALIAETGKKWRESPAFDTFVSLKHSNFGRILQLLQDGQISVGKACEVLAEVAHGIDLDAIPIPATCQHEFPDDAVPAEELGDLRRRIEELESADHSQEYKQAIQELAVLPKNWDSYGAPPPSMAALLAAEKVLHSKAAIVPRSNGGVQLDWPCGSELSFNPDGSQELDDVAIAAFNALADRHKAILGREIAAEMDSQYPEFGPEQDDGHDRLDWGRFIKKFTAQAEDHEMCDFDPMHTGFESNMIKVAALAIAAVKSSRRKRNAS